MTYSVNKINKKKLMFILVPTVVVLAIAVVILVQSFADNKGYRTISIVEVSGTVGVIKDGIEYKAYAGMHLQEGCEIITLGNSYVRLVLDGDKYVKLEGGSKLRFETLGFLGSGKTKLKLDRGALTTELVNPLGDNEEYVINTPNAVLAVRGTYFRVDLNNLEKGEVLAKVTTYGGAVASQRIMPNGEVVDEEVIIEAGYKTTIHKDDKDTVYVVEDVEGAIDYTEDGNLDLEPINIDEISDDDLVDIYFSVENGHELFISMEEVKEKLEEREVNIEEKVSVYEIAMEVMIAQDMAENGKSNTTSHSVVANDSKPLPKEENIQIGEENIVDSQINIVVDGDLDTIEKPDSSDTTQEPESDTEGDVEGDVEDTPQDEDSEGDVEGTPEDDSDGTTEDDSEGDVEDIPEDENSSGITDESESDLEEDTDSEESTQEPENDSEEDTEGDVEGDIEDTPQEDDSEGDVEDTPEDNSDGTTEDDSEGDVEDSPEDEDSEEESDSSDELLHEHTYKEAVTKEATCTQVGEKTFTCECGETYFEEIAAIGHSWGEWTTIAVPDCIYAGEESRMCEECGEKETQSIEELGHSYAQDFTVDTEVSCTEAGSKSKHCSRCGSKSEVTAIPALGHTEIAGGTAEIHSLCHTCGETLGNETAHVYVDEVTTEAKCDAEGVTTYTCDCGYSYTKPIEKIAHTEVEENNKATLVAAGHYKKYCSSCEEVFEEYDIPKLDALYVDDGDIIISSTGYMQGDDELVGYDGVYTIAQRDTSVSASCTITVESGTQSIVMTGVNISTGGLVINSGAEVTLDGTANNVISSSQAIINNGSLTAVGGSFQLDNTTAITGIEKIIYDSIPDEETRTFIKANGVTYVYNITTEDAASDGKYYVLKPDVDIIINGVTFPDAAFRTYVTNYFDSDSNGYLNKEEIANAQVVEMPEDQGKDIATLKGIEYLTSLQNISISDGSNITEMDLRKNTALTYLDVKGTQISEVDLANNAELTYVNLSQSNITSIDLSNNDKVSYLILKETEITDLDLSDNTSITYIDMTSSQLMNLDVSGCTSLSTLQVPNTNVSTLDLSGVSSLVTLKAGNTKLDDIDLTGCTGLTSMDICNCESLTNIALEEAKGLKTLNVSGCSNLTNLKLTSNYNLETLNASNSGISGTLYISANRALVTLNTQNCTSLTGINCTMHTENSNELKNVNVTGCTSLEALTLWYCSKVESLDITTLSSLKKLNIYYAGIEELNGKKDVMDFGNNTSLEEILVTGDIFSEYDVSACTNLKTFSLDYYSDVQSLDFSNNTKLETLSLVSVNALDSLDISGCTQLKSLGILGSKLSALDLTHCANIETVSLSGNTNLASFEVSDCESLKTLTLKGSRALTELTVSGCTNLESVDLSSNSALSNLAISGSSNLVQFNMSGCTGLTDLNLSGSSSLSQIDLTENTALTKLNLRQCTNLTMLDVSSLTALTSLDVMNSGVTELNVSANTALTTVNANGCTSLRTFTAAAAGLQTNVLYTINLRGCTSLIGLEVTNCDVLGSVDLYNSNNITTFIVTNAGVDWSARNCIFVISSGAYTEDDIIGWDSAYMSFG